MSTSVSEILTAGNVVFTTNNLTTIKNLAIRYHAHGFNASQQLIAEYIVRGYNKEKPNLKQIFHSLHYMKFARIKKDTKIGRNDECPCGSGKKYKKCCINKKVRK